MKTSRIASLVGLFAIAALFTVTMGARASIITDIPEALNDALFDGGSMFAARAILTAAILMSAGLALGVARLPMAPTFIVLIGVLGALTAIGWADVAMMVIAIFIAAGMFGKTVYEKIWGGGTPGPPGGEG